MPEPIWLDPASITHKISPSADLSGIQPGDWDIQRRHGFADTAKASSIRQHFADGTPWIETDLFADTYRRRLERDGHIRGHGSLDGLAASYDRIDRLAADMKRHGFLLADGRGKQFPPLALLIGRDGTASIGNQGNHRLAIAQVFELGRVAGVIVCRHQLAP